jgi:biopolymer transport protein ExbD
MQPPLTPMIDVVFQLLIFFLLACTFKMTEGVIKAKLPAIAGPQDTPPLRLDPIKITLSATGSKGEGALVEVSGGGGVARNALELRGILIRLREHHQSGEVPVLIKPTAQVHWKHTVEAFNQAVIAKFNNIAFAPADA